MGFSRAAIPTRLRDQTSDERLTARAAIEHAALIVANYSDGLHAPG